MTLHVLSIVCRTALQQVRLECEAALNEGLIDTEGFESIMDAHSLLAHRVGVAIGNGRDQQPTRVLPGDEAA